MGEEIMTMMNEQIFGVWFLIGAALVFWMQAGFAMVEAGFARAKNTGNILVQLDKVEQRFMLMKFMHYNANSDYYASTDAHPYVFVSQFDSVLSYLTTRVAETDEYGNAIYDSNGIPVWDTTVYFADKYFKDDGFESITTPGFLDTTSPYEYEVSSYLLSNVSSPKYQRNGWYLWQDATPTINTRIWNNEYYTNLMVLGKNSQITNGNNTIDDRLSAYVSSQAKVTSDGVILTSDHSNESVSTTDNWGYIRINSTERIVGVRVIFALVNTTTTLNTPTDSILKLRTYDLNGTRLDCPISYSNVAYGQDIYWDTDEFSQQGLPYYVVVPKSEKDGNVSITILFDLDKIDTDIYTVTFDPFDFANQNNTMTIKTITIISDVKDYLK